jgi:hypothetical protein
MSDNLPDVSKVDLDYSAVIDLHLATNHFGIYQSPHWQEQLLASRVRRDPGKCLEKALNVRSLDIDLAVTVISRLPYPHLSTINDKIDLVTARAQPADITSAIVELGNQPLPLWTAHAVSGGDVILRTGPSLALVLAVEMAKQEDSRTTQAAADGCLLAQKQLAGTVAVDFSILWPMVRKLAGSAPWMSVDD